jgi:hypothetical protein
MEKDMSKVLVPVLKLSALFLFLTFLNRLAHNGYTKEAMTTAYIVIGLLGVWYDFIIVNRYVVMVFFVLGYNAHYGWNLTPINDTERILDGISMLMFVISLKDPKKEKES